MVNKELLSKTLEHIKKNQQGWNQELWRIMPGLTLGKPEPLPTMCGTAMCFAGEAIQLTEPDKWLVSVQDTLEASKLVADGKLDPSIFYTLDRDIDKVIVDEANLDAWVTAHPLTGVTHATLQAGYRAKELLGLDTYQADILFSSHNTLDDLETYVDRLLNDQYIYVEDDASERDD